MYKIILYCIIIVYLFFYNNYSNPKYLPIKMKQSEIKNAGKGIFAIKNIKKDELIETCPFLLENKKKVQGILQDYYFDASNYGKNKIIFPLGYCGIYNHSPNNNANYYQGSNHTIKIIANQIIYKGDEITINYGDNYWKSRSIQAF